ncbi:hypothetical protein C8Q74DRAFT_1216891 [Fomes fomentarius]|nr:hypothetical protein C8Q74DRAFT_1216891 [Fomes fomentarius]
MSTLGLKLAIPLAVCLLGLPTELQTRILEAVRGEDLLTCRKVCKTWRALIRDTSALQYAVRLVLTGMRDGPQGGAPIPERLKALKAYEAAWDTNQVPIHTLARPSKQYVSCIFTGGVFIYETGDSCLKLHRPPSLLTGITERSWTVNYGVVFDDDSDIDDQYSCAVDVAQDLVVVTKLKRDEFPECHLLSLSSGSSTHPLAQRATLSDGSNLCFSIDIQEEIAIAGDFIEWTVHGMDTCMHVYNWKTGVVLWEDNICVTTFHGPEPEYGTRCRILNPSYVLKIVGLDINVYPMRRHRSGENEFAAICQLQLPPLANQWTAGLPEVHMQRPPTYTDCRPHFEGNPEHTVMVLQYAVTNMNQECSVVVFIPLSTILKVVQSASAEHGATASKGGIKIILWDDWVVHGARVVVLPVRPRVSAMGSRVALAIPARHAVLPLLPGEAQVRVQTSHEVFLFDMHPYVRQAAVNDPVPTPPWISDCYTSEQTPIFQEPVRSTLPYRMAKTELTVEGGMGYWKMYLSPDASLWLC